jgi:phospholipid/cholesterol/gamma-HCH transport system permease protein
MGTLRVFVASLGAFFRAAAHGRPRWRETVEQMYALAVQSLPVVVFSLLFLAFMLVGELSFHMKLILQQDSLVPGFTTVLLARELGPVVTCLLLTSRVGAGIAAEVGSMKITDQIDALRLLGIDPIEYLAVPRWIACVFAGVSLSLVALAVALIGGAAVASHAAGVPIRQFFNTMFVFTRYSDIVCCALKGAVFGTLLPMIAVQCGLTCRGGSQGVGEAATGAVVRGSIAIIVADFVVTYCFFAL